jgi:acetyltransferase-like isoleucine patch superfamily enzyme
VTRHPALHGARDFVTLARAKDLIEDAGLAAAYGAAFGPEDDATLLIAAPGADDTLVAELQTSLETAGLADGVGPDMLLVPYADLDELEPHVDAVLRSAARAAAGPGFDGETMPQLARRYEQRRAAAADPLATLGGGHEIQRVLELLTSPHRMQDLRIERFHALSTCRDVSGSPKRAQPLLCVGSGRIEFGEGVEVGWPSSPGFYSAYTYIEAATRASLVRVGDRCMFNNTVTLRSEGPGIDVGPDTLFGTEAQVFDSDFHGLHPARRHGGHARMAEVRIGRNVWLGSNVMVLRGVSIGDDTVVGAGSVVSRSLPAGVIAAGNPARVVRSLEDVG